MGYRWFNLDVGPFEPRDGLGVAVFNNQMWIYGGWSPGRPGVVTMADTTMNDIWVTSTPFDSASWVRADDHADWEPRHTFGLVEGNGELLIIGGDIQQGHYQTDVWRTVDGIHFTQLTDSTPWGERMLMLTTYFGGKYWVIGGQTISDYVPGGPSNLYTDAWSSVDGVTWIKEADNLPFLPRGSIDEIAVHNGYMWVVGGGLHAAAGLTNHVVSNDVWRSADGINWEQVLAEAPWEARRYNNVEVYDGKIWVVGGSGEKNGIPYNLADSWWSEDGVTWHQVEAPFAPRHASSLAEYGGSLFMISGNNMQSDVWALRQEIIVEGDDGANILSGDGTDRLIGGLGDDIYYYHDRDDIFVEYVGGGRDTVFVDVSYTLAPSMEIEILSARDLTATDPVNLTGNEFANGLVGNAGINVLDGAEGADTLEGGAGDDIYYVNGDDSVIEAADAGYDVIFAREDFTLTAGAHVEVVSAIDNFATTAINLTGNELDNYLSGNAGANILTGMGGRDYLGGREGDDIYYVDQTDIILENAGEGYDSAYVTESYILSNYADVERLSVADIASTNAINLTGNSLDNQIIGNAGANRIDGGDGADSLYGGDGDDHLDGGAGDDTMTGGTGDDIYHVDSDNDIVVETAGEGTDTIISAISQLQLAANVENLTLSGNASLYAYGDDLDNVITGNSGNNILVGRGGADTLVGGLGDDTLRGGHDSDRLEGGAGVDILYGDAGNDTLDGGAGADTLYGGEGNDNLTGGEGNDSYFVSAGDTVIETATGGYDVVYASEDYTLSAGAHVEVLSTINNLATTAINLTGNELDNYLSGNAGANILTGMGGRDYLGGREGDDIYYVDQTDIILENAGEGYDSAYVTESYILSNYADVERLSVADTASTNAINLTGNSLDNRIIGNAGANRIDGLGGADILEGRAGDDVYFVDTADTILENAGEGYDSVFTSGNYTLNASAELELLSAADTAATSSLSLTGNSFANRIVGNAGANVLNGLGGADILQGGNGDDSYYVDNLDTVVETATGGYDVVYASNHFTLSAGAYVEVLSTINNFATTAINLTGNELDNLLTGNAGANVLNGMAGRDYLHGSGGADIFVFESGTGADRILDFTRGEDRIDLSAFHLTFAELQARFSQSGAGGYITMASGESIYLYNLQMDQLTAGDFIL